MTGRGEFIGIGEQRLEGRCLMNIRRINKFGKNTVPTKILSITLPTNFQLPIHFAFFFLTLVKFCLPDIYDS